MDSERFWAPYEAGFTSSVDSGWKASRLPDNEGVLIFPSDIGEHQHNFIAETFFDDNTWDDPTSTAVVKKGLPPSNCKKISPVYPKSDSILTIIHSEKSPESDHRGNVILEYPMVVDSKRIRPSEGYYWEYQFCSTRPDETDSEIPPNHSSQDLAILSLRSGKIDDAEYHNIKVTVPPNQVEIYTNASEHIVHVIQVLEEDGSYSLNTSLPVVNRENIQTFVKRNPTTDKFLTKLAKVDGFYLSLNDATSLKWKLDVNPTLDMSPNSLLRLYSVPSNKGSMSVEINVPARNIREFGESGLWDGFPTVYQFDYSMGKQKRLRHPKVKRITQDPVSIMTTLYTLYGTKEAILKIVTQVLRNIHDFHYDGVLIPNSLLHVVDNNPRSNVITIVADKMVKGDFGILTLEEAQHKIQQFSIEELRTLGKSILLDLLFASQVLTPSQSNLIFLNHLVTFDDVKKYKSLIRSMGAEYHLLQSLKNTIGDHHTDVEHTLNEIGQQITSTSHTNLQMIGCEAICITLIITAISVGGAIATVAAGELATTALKGRGGWGDMLRKKARALKFGIKRLVGTKILGKSKEQVNSEIAAGILENLATQTPAQLAINVKLLPVTELINIPEHYEGLTVEVDDPSVTDSTQPLADDKDVKSKGKEKKKKKKKLKVVDVKPGEDLLKRLITQEILAVEQIHQIQVLAPNRIKPEWLDGTIYDQKYSTYIKSLSKRQLDTIQPPQLIDFVKSAFFTESQLKYLIYGSKVLRPSDLKGTKYKAKFIKKAADLPDDLPDADAIALGIPGSKVIGEALSSDFSRNLCPYLAPKDTEFCVFMSVISKKLPVLIGREFVWYKDTRNHIQHNSNSVVTRG